MARALFLALFAAVVFFPIYFLFLRSPPPLPEMDLNAWWGPESLREKQDAEIRKFKVRFNDVMVKELKERIKLSRQFTPPLEGVAFEYGFNSNQLDTWLKYWSEEYDFKDRARFFNQYPNFKTNIQGLNIHFVHVKPEVPEGVEVVPVLLLHGWPGSVREFYDAIPLLSSYSKDRNFALELIIPSLPGYGFSDAAVRPGLGATEIAVVFKNLMNRLGFNKYYVQGGDWGSMIVSNMATLFPEEILGLHTNMGMVMSPAATALEFLVSLWPSLVIEEHLVSRAYPLAERFSTLIEEMGYMHIQATKPDTVGVALSDSPAGLLAYIVEKFSAWTNMAYRSKPDGGIEIRFTKEQIIDNLMLYWSTNSITTSMRLYAESFNKRHFGLRIPEIPTPVPVWIIQAKNELAYQPPFILRMKYPNLLNVTVLEDGGHFFAFEFPKIFAEDVIKAIGEFRKLSKVKTEL